MSTLFPHLKGFLDVSEEYLILGFVIKQNPGTPGGYNWRVYWKQEPTVPTNQNSLFRSRDWSSANQGPAFFIVDIP